MKKKIIKIVFFVLGFFLLGLVGVMAYIKTALPNVGPAKEMVVEITPERVERGKYLANHVTICMDCHSTRDWKTFSGPIVPGTEGMGGEIFDQNLGFPGRFVSKNITPYALGNWTDGEIFRAITTGVSKDNKALFNIMPHHNYGKMAEEDINSIIAYVRTLEPKEFTPEPSKADFPMNFIINTIPKEAQFQEIPPKSDVVNYGRYIVNAAACFDCHTKHVKGKVAGKNFAGGFEFPFPDGSVIRTANITPSEAGIGSWTEEQFIARFKAYADSSYVPHQVAPGEFQTVMPWTLYSKMNVEDLAAVYQYLRTLEPVEESVVVFTPAK